MLLPIKKPTVLVTVIIPAMMNGVATLNIPVVGARMNAPPEPPTSHPCCRVAMAELRSRGVTLSTVNDLSPGDNKPNPIPHVNEENRNMSWFVEYANVNIPNAVASNPGIITAALPTRSATIPATNIVRIMVDAATVKYNPGLPS